MDAHQFGRFKPRTWTHHIGNGIHSACGLDQSVPFRLHQIGYTSDWTAVTCPVCLSRKPEPRSAVVEKPITLTEYNNAGPKRKPPRMENLHGQVDGVFKFYDVDYYHRDAAFRQTDALEVVPQQNGNVEITLGESIFTLSHLDRADLIRALLCDFHYSPEVGGPSDD